MHCIGKHDLRCHRDPRESFDLQIPLAPIALRIDTATKIFYELHLTNFATDPLTIEGVDVLASNDTPILRLDAQAIENRLGRPGPPAKHDRRTIEPGMHVVLYFETDLTTDPMPRDLHHRVVYSFASKDASRKQAAVRCLVRMRS